MANHTIVDYVTDRQNTASAVTALLETKLETLDSTTNPVYGIGIQAVGTEFYGYIIYKG